MCYFFLSCIRIYKHLEPEQALPKTHLEIAEVHLIPLLKPGEGIIPNGRHDVGLAAGIRNGGIDVVCLTGKDGSVKDEIKEDKVG